LRNIFILCTALLTAPPLPAQVDGDSVPRATRPYDIVRFRSFGESRWIVGTVTGVSGDTIVVALHDAPPATPAARLALDTVHALERQARLPGSRVRAAGEGFFWGAIAGGIMGWLGGATYGALAGGTTWSEGGANGALVGASALGVAGAVTLGTRHMRGDNGPESIRLVWVPVPLARDGGAVR
jgi:hypothetical protein